MLQPNPYAPGRLGNTEPISIIDIGSNSVRLVIYEGLRRNPTPIFNEKVLAGLGRGLASSGKLYESGVERAIAALKRFRTISDNLGAKQIHAIATAAARDATNGDAFVERAEAVLKSKIQLLDGEEEARLTAYGILCGFVNPDGVVGDLGGGSLELVRVDSSMATQPNSMPLGVLRLMDEAAGQFDRLPQIIRDEFSGMKIFEEMKGLPFYAIGGTFRAFSALHMAHTGYPLHVMHGYQINSDDARDFAEYVANSNPEMLAGIGQVSKARLPLLVYGAAILKQIIELGRPSEIVISALGVREGLLYSLLSDKQKKLDPLIEASAELCMLRSRAPRHSHELCEWSDGFFDQIVKEESEYERRLRYSACLLADIGWRAHPDYRGEQSLNIIANAGFVGLDHAGRAFLALTVHFRYVGLLVDQLSPRIKELATPRLMHHARLLGALLRVAYLITGSAEGVIKRTKLLVHHELIELQLPNELAPLEGERLAKRLNALAKLTGKQSKISVA